MSNRVKPKSARMTATTKILVGSGATLALLGSMTAAQATTPGYGGTITACYAKSGGAVRIIDPSTYCKSTETLINWNQAGPMGPQGPQGVKGNTGATGATGPAGPAGAC